MYHFINDYFDLRGCFSLVEEEAREAKSYLCESKAEIDGLKKVVTDLEEKLFLDSKERQELGNVLTKMHYELAKSKS